MLGHGQGNGSPEGDTVAGRAINGDGTRQRPGLPHPLLATFWLDYLVPALRTP